MMDFCTKKILERQKRKRKSADTGNKAVFRSVLRMFFVFSGLFLVLLFATHYAHPGIDKVKDMLSLQVRDVEVRGNEILSRQNVLNAAGVSEDTNLLTVDLGKIRNKLAKNPFVKKVKVVRVLPASLRIRVTERKPYAVLEDEGLWYLDTDGVPFKRIEAAKGESLDFPVLTGVPKKRKEAKSYRASVLRQSLAILNQLVDQKIVDTREISEINFCEIYGFSFYLGRRPLRIILGFENIEKKLTRFKDLIGKLRSKTGMISLIDMDYTNKAVVKLKRAI